MTIQDFLNQLYGGFPPSPPSSSTYQPNYTQVSGVDAIKQAVREKAAFGILQAGARSTASYDLSQAWTGYQNEPAITPVQPSQPATSSQPIPYSPLPTSPPPSEIQQSVYAIRHEQRKLNDLLSKYPRNELGQIPMLAVDIPLNSRLYFDQDKGEINYRRGVPLFLAEDGSLTPEDTGRHALFEYNLAKKMLQEYQTFSEYATTSIYKQTEGKKVFEPLTLELLEEKRKSGKIQGESEEPIYVDFTAHTRQATPGVVSVKAPKEEWWKDIPRFLSESGKFTRDIWAKMIWEAQNRPAIDTIGIDLTKPDPTGFVIGFVALNTVSTLMGGLIRGIRSIKSSDRTTQPLRWLSTYAEATDREGLKEVVEAVDEQVKEIDEQSDRFAFETFDDFSNYLQNYLKVTTDIALGVEEPDLRSDYVKKEIVVEGWNTIINEYDLTDPVQLRTALDNTVELLDLDATTGTRNLYATWTGMSDPEIDKQFKYMVAQVMLRKGQWLTKEEIEQLKGYVADPMIEFTGEVIFDLNNLLNLPASSIFSEDALRAWSKATGVRNVMEHQLDSLILASVFRTGQKAINFPIDEFLTATKLDKKMLGLWKKNMYFGSQKALAKISNRQIAKLIHNNTTDLFNSLLDGSGKIVKDLPASMFDDLNDMGREIAELKSKGINNVDEIVSIIKEGKKYPVQMSSSKRITDVIRMVDIKNPLLEGDEGWTKLLSDGFANARSERATAWKEAFVKNIDWGDLTKDTKFPEVNKILQDSWDVEPDQQLAFVGRELEKLSKKFANERLIADTLAQKLGSVFSESFLKDHIIFNGYGVRFMDDSLRGIVDKWMTKKGGGWIHVRNFIRGSQDVLAWMTSNWIKNILSRKPAFYAFQQPFEQAMTHILSNKGGLVERTTDYFTNTPELLKAIDDMPAGGKYGFASILDVSKDVNSTKYVDGLRAFYTANPESWLPVPDSFSLYFSESMRRSYDSWLAKLFKDAEVDDLTEQYKILEEAAQQKRFIGKLKTAYGDIPTVLGRPMDLGERIKSAWKATAEMGGELASSSELITKAKIAQEHYLIDKVFASDMAFRELANVVRVQLKSAGMADNLIDDFIDNSKRIWDNADGRSMKFINDMKIKATGKTPVAYATIPDEIKNLPMGMDFQEQQNFFMKTRASLNNYLTELQVSNKPVTKESVHEFFEKTLDVYRKSADEASNAMGLHGYNIFGDSITKRPISADTQRLLETIDAGKTPTKYTPKLEQILKDNNISMEGKTVQQALSELQEAVRPTSWADFEQTKVMAAIDESLPLQARMTTSFDLDERVQAYWADELHRIQLESTLTKMPGERVPAKESIRLQKRAAYLESLSEEERLIKQPQLDYVNSTGKLRSVQRNLDAQYRANKADETAGVLSHAVWNTLDNDQRIQSLFFEETGGFFNQVFPGFKLGKISGEERFAKELWEESQTLLSAAYAERAKYFESYYDSITKNLPVKRLAYGDELSFYGIGVIPEEDGFGIKAFTFDRRDGGGILTFDKNSSFYKSMRDKLYFGMVNMEVWNAPIDLPPEELLKLRQLSTPINPKFNIDVKLHEPLRQEFMRSYLSSPAFGENTLWKYIEPYMAGKTIDEVTQKDIIKALKEAAKANKDTNTGKNIQDLADHLDHVDKYFYHNHLVGDIKYSIPFTSKTVPEDIRAFTEIKIKTASQLKGIEEAFKKWEDSVVQQSADGLLMLKSIDATHGESLNSAARLLAEGAVDLEDKLWHGGDVFGITLEGAIPYAKQRMRVGTESVYDQFAKGIVPFWNFSTRGAATWARFAVEHPQLVRLYQKYLQLGRGQALTSDLTNRNGQPLPSTLGKMRLARIAGFDIWFNPMNITSPFFAYFFPFKAMERYDDENPEMNDWQSAVAGMLSMIRNRGARVGPLVDIALSMFGIKDLYTSQTTAEKAAWFGISSLIPADLVHPVVWNALDAGLNKAFSIYDYDTIRPEVSWMDSLVETEILKDYLDKIKDAPNETMKIRLAGQIEILLKEREKNKDYKKYVNIVRDGNYYKQISGYFTGIYPNWYTPGQVELSSIQKQNNILIDAINNEFTAPLLFPGKSPEEIYEQRSNFRYKTGVGELWNVRNNVSWVTDADGNAPKTRELRRELINQSFDTEVKQESMYAEIGVVRQRYADARRELALGKDYKDPAFEQLRIAETQELLNIQANYPDVESDWNFWYVGYQPESMIDEKFTNNLNYLLMGTRPTYDKTEETFPQYELRLQKWEQNIPLLVNEMLPIFTQQLVTHPITAYADQDVIGAIDRIAPTINANTFNAWMKDNDTAPEALERAYEELYTNFYFTEVYGVSGAMKIQAEDTFHQRHPKPTDDQLIDWVLAEYEDKWTREELQEAMRTPSDKEREILPAEEALTRGDTEDDTVRDNIYNMWGWIPQNRKSEFYEKFQLNGGSEDDLTTFFNTGIANPFKVDERYKLTQIESMMEMTLTQMGITRPKGVELSLQVEAQQLNEQLVDMLTIQLGEDYEEVIREYGALGSTSLRKEWKERYPEKGQIVDAYYKIRDEYAKKYPLWAQFYVAQKSGASYYGYGGGGGYRGYGGGGRRSSGRAYARQTDGSLLPIGMRSTTDPNQLLDPAILGRGGVAGVPRLSQRIWSTASVELRREVVEAATDETKTLSTAGVKYLRKIAERNPKHAEEIEEFIQSVSK